MAETEGGIGMAKTCPTIDAPKGQVEQVFLEQNELLDRLIKLVSRLGEKIDPIMFEGLNTKDCENGEERNLVQLASRINMHNGVIRNQCDVIENFIGRIEL